MSTTPVRPRTLLTAQILLNLAMQAGTAALVVILACAVALAAASVRVLREYERAVVFRLGRCLPLKVKAPALNAREGIVAIEELHVAYEYLRVREEATDG